MNTRNTSLVLMIGACNLAWAEENALDLPATTISARQEQPSGVILDQPIKTGSRLGLTARETPASVSVADRSIIEERGAKDTQDVINSMTGINASANPGFGGFVSYRGFTQNQITQLYNGIGMSYSSATRPVDAWIYDRVELIGGRLHSSTVPGLWVVRSTTSPSWPAGKNRQSKAACAMAAMTPQSFRLGSTMP